jgi:hypothetical protein
VVSDSKDELIGEPIKFPCQMAPEQDWLEVRRVGVPGTQGCSLAFTAVVDEPDFTDEDDPKFVASILLSPARARQLIVALLETTDEASGGFTNLLTDEEE